jgi:hypothetical protein
MNQLRRVSPSLIVALLALFVAVGGTAIAVNKINGKTIKKKTIPANRVKPNALTGKQINEAKLGVVPKATTADSATSAQNATTADTATTADAATTAGTADSAATADVADDSKRLGNVLATSYTRGGGTMVRKRVLIDAGDTSETIVTISNGGTLRGGCGAGADQLNLTMFNSTSATRDVVLSAINTFDNPPAGVAADQSLAPNATTSPAVSLLGSIGFVSTVTPGTSSITSLQVAHVDKGSQCEVIVTGWTNGTVS